MTGCTPDLRAPRAGGSAPGCAPSDSELGCGARGRRGEVGCGRRRRRCSSRALPRRLRRGRPPTRPDGGTPALGVRRRARCLRALGQLPRVLAAARAGGVGGDPRPPHRLDPRRDADPAHGPARLDAAAGPVLADVGDHHRGLGAHHHQLGRLHLGRDPRPRRGERPGLLHEPAGLGGARRRRARGAPAPGAVGGGRDRHGGGGGALGGDRHAALGGPDPGVQLRVLRAAQEAGAARAGRRADRGGIPARPDRDRLPRLAAGGGHRDVRARDHSHAAADRGGPGDRDPAAALRRRRQAAAAGHPGTVAVREPDAAVRLGRARGPRADAARALDRVRAGLGRSRVLHRRRLASAPAGGPRRGPRRRLSPPAPRCSPAARTAPPGPARRAVPRAPHGLRRPGRPAPSGSA